MYGEDEASRVASLNRLSLRLPGVVGWFVGVANLVTMTERAQPTWRRFVKL